jgi:toxin ParE1/3/4
MREVIWSRDAYDDLGEILDYYAAFDEQRALRLIDEIEAVGNALGQYPTGRPGRDHGTFEKSLPKLRYIIAYDLGDGEDGAVNILRVIHSARQWRRGEQPD